MRKNNTIRISYIGIISVALLFCVIIIKLVYVSYASVVDGMDLQKKAASRNTTKSTIRASRGTIFSADGEALAQNVNSYTLIAYVDGAASRTTNPNKPRHVVDKEYTANVLSEYLNLSPQYILDRLNTKAYQVEFGTAGKDLTEKQKSDIEALELPGIDFIKSQKRYYPCGDFASYIVGYAKKKDNSDEIVGELGVEMYYDNELAGQDGSITYQRDAYGYQIADTPVITEEATSGLDIYLTIDSKVQMYMEDALTVMADEHNFEWASVTIANAKTGAILASAVTPSYDPNKMNITNWNSPLVSYQYEPGSTMKIFSYMAAIDSGAYNGEEKYMSGEGHVGNDKVNDWNKVGWGMISYDTGFTYSSNVAAANLGLKIGRETLVDYYKKFGFGRKTGVEMADEYSGKIDPKWDLEVANAAFGQGITTTPVQNIQALTALANKGEIVRPYIVSKVIDPASNEVVYEGKRNVVGQAVKEETVKKMLELMYLTVNGEDRTATGRVYKTEATTLIGKTGTAQIASSTGGYLKGNYNNIRSFAGLFPYEDPEYVIYMSVKKLEASSSVLAKTVKSIVESMVKYKNLDQLTVEADMSKIINVSNYINKDTEVTKTSLEHLGLEVIILGDGTRVIDQFPNKGAEVMRGSKMFLLTNSVNITMPNMTGWSSNEVGSFCNLAGINYNITGYGRVTSQSIEQGALLNSSVDLNLTLSKETNERSDESGEDSGQTTNE